MQTAHYIVSWIYYLLMIFFVKGLIQISIPYVDYFYKWKANKFIRMYTSLCQFKEVGKFKWPPVNFYMITPHDWFNNNQYTISGNEMFEGIGTHIFSQIKQAFLIKQFIDKRGEKRESKKMAKIMCFWNNTQTWRDKITSIIKFKSKEKQQILVIYQSDDNYDKLLNPLYSNGKESVTFTGEHSLLFVFYLKDKTEIYRINNAEILQEKTGLKLDDKIIYFYIDKTKLERI